MLVFLVFNTTEYILHIYVLYVTIQERPNQKPIAMRPPILFPIFADIRTLPGVGPKLAQLLQKVAGGNVARLLWLLPTSIIDRRNTPKIRNIFHGDVVTVVARVDAHVPPPLPRRPYKVRCMDETGLLELVFFHANQKYLESTLPIGKKVVISGKAEIFNKTPQINHPGYIDREENLAKIAIVEPIYPLTAGLSHKLIRKIIGAALEKIPELPEWIDGDFAAQNKFQDWKKSITAVHNPTTEYELSPMHPNRRRLAYDELLSNQLALALVRRKQHQMIGKKISGDGSLRKKVLAALPFGLTKSQETALEEIYVDMASEKRMLRLLQGDVGSGKTLVAFMAMLNAVEAGYQAAFMVPTEILARQHMSTIEPLAAAAGVQVAILTGRENGGARDKIIAGLADGSIKLAIGTHALFQEDVVFDDLGLAVIDEQHRFGVHQRMLLSSKGKGESGKSADLLVMTATPIPRTLTLTAYGDMDSSRLLEKPPGRQPIDTRLIPLDRLDEVVEKLRSKIATGARAYWVCPLIEESEVVDLAAATERYAHLKSVIGDKVGMLHGRMKPADKDAVMTKFQSGEIQALVSTTVIEVGVDVPEAVVMVIEHAERFGLAQLHQLRGRVGRGTSKSSCLLLYDKHIGEVAQARLKIMRETEDGFRIAEEDLRLRGAGEILGTRQSGMVEFTLADLNAHSDLLAQARDDASHIVTTDPDLLTPRGQALRVLLYLFEHDASVKYLRSG